MRDVLVPSLEVDQQCFKALAASFRSRGLERGLVLKRRYARLVPLLPMRFHLFLQDRLDFRARLEFFSLLSSLLECRAAGLSVHLFELRLNGFMESSLERHP